jgi:hypothetical protein
MCYFLFRLQAAEKFWGVYPGPGCWFEPGVSHPAVILVGISLRRQKTISLQGLYPPGRFYPHDYCPPMGLPALAILFYARPVVFGLLQAAFR